MAWRPPHGWRAAGRQVTRGAVRVRRLPPAELATTLHALVVMAFVEILIRRMRLERLAGVLGVEVDLSPPAAVPPAAGASRLTHHARRQQRGVERVARGWPFSHGPCLRRALVLGHLLRRLEPAVRLGVAGSGADLRAHAWLEIDGSALEDVGEYRSFHTPREETR